MTKKTISVGTTPNDGTGDKLNIAFGKVNDNFTELYDNKEDSLEFGSNSQFLAGDKTWKDLNTQAVVGLQTALDGKVDEGDVTTSGITQNGAGILGRITGTSAAAVQRLTPAQVKGYLSLDNVDNTSDANKPISTATATALAGKEPSLPTGGAGQYLRGDKTFQDLNKTAVGLSQVDNTSDANKPTFNGTTNGLVKAPGATDYASGLKFLASDGSWKDASASSGGVTSVNTRTGAVTLAKGDVGLANVDNTSDANKPVSNATQTALDAKEPSLPATPSAPTTKFLNGNRTFVAITATTVGLGNVDNTSDLDKPISTATQAALDLKAPTSSLIRAVKFFYRNAAAMDPTKAAVDVVTGSTTLTLARCVAKATTANSTQVVFNILKNGVNIGTVTFAADALTGTIAIPVSSDLAVVAGDYLEVVAPSTGLDSLAGMTVVLRN